MKKEFDFVGFWAEKCRSDMSECRRQVLEFNDAQLLLANEFYKRLEKTMGGRKKVLALIAHRMHQ